MNDVVVDYDMSDDDHIPMSFKIHVDLLPKLSEEVNDINTNIKWDSVPE